MRTSHVPGKDDHDNIQEIDESEHVLPVGGILNAYKRAERDPMITSCVLYMIFLMLFVSIVTLVRPVHTIYTVQNAIHTALASEAMSPATTHFEKTFYDIANWGDFWIWVETVLYEKSFSCCYYNGQSYLVTYGNSNDRRIASYNRLMTPIRFRQARVKTDTCKSTTPKENHELARPCWGFYDEEVKDTFDRWAGNTKMDSKYLTGLSNFVGDTDDGPNYGTTGHVVDLDLDTGKASAKVTQLMKERWTDEWTRGVSIDVNTYNPNYDLATVARFRIDVGPGGHFFPTVEFLSCRMNPYSTVFDLIRLLLEVIFALFLVFYCFEELKELYTGGVKAYFNSFWNVVELGNLTLFILIIYKWIIFMTLSKADFTRRERYVFHDLYTVADVFNGTAYYAAVNVVWSFSKVFKYLQLYSRFLIIWDVLAHSMKYIMPFMVIIMLIVIAYAYSGNWLYGQRVDNFHTIRLTFSTLLLSMVDGFEYEGMRDASPGLSSFLWAVMWMVMSTLVLLNMFIAILSDSYCYVQDRIKKQEHIEKSYDMPSLILYIRSKIPCLRPRNLDAEEAMLDMKQQAVDLREHLGQVDRDAMWKLLLDRVVDDSPDIVVNDIVKFFPDEDEEESFRLASEWMERLARLGKMKMQPTERERSTLDEISTLREKVTCLEDEISKLTAALAFVAPNTPAFYGDAVAGR